MRRPPFLQRLQCSMHVVTRTSCAPWHLHLVKVWVHGHPPPQAFFFPKNPPSIPYDTQSSLLAPQSHPCLLRLASLYRSSLSPFYPPFSHQLVYSQTHAIPSYSHLSFPCRHTFSSYSHLLLYAPLYEEQQDFLFF